MTYEEAIKYFEQHFPRGIDMGGLTPKQTAYNAAIEALQKQTPTKPNYQGDEACMDAYCPYCGEILDDGEVLCEHCHQIIDWSDNK